ncbi:MAG: hypothetical protein EB136_07000, partial [Synechococcaceae bacterium WBB_3_034]|nr:hypothetical protein [Synechococcaceae bacterium WBB_3_034]
LRPRHLAPRSDAPGWQAEIEVARVHEFRAGSGLPVRVPVVDMIEIGAGGGSGVPAGRVSGSLMAVVPRRG